MAKDSLVLVTGISGFLGKHVAVALLKAGYRVRGTVRYSVKREEVLRTFRTLEADPARLEVVKADLTADDNWTSAANGCRFVMHVASPFPRRMPFDRLALVDVAKGGTLRVLRAAARAGAERIVLTSSVAAIYYGHPDRGDAAFTPADFSDVQNPSVGSYAVSKTLAEQAAWEFAAVNGLDLVAMNPAVILGPLLDDSHGTSVGIVRTMMRGRVPLVPRASVGIVDVRDVVEAHVRSLSVPDAAGKRFILSSASMSLLEVGRSLRQVAPHLIGLPRAHMPDAVVRLAGRFSSQAHQLVPELGRVKRLDTSLSENMLGIRYRSPVEAVRATAESLMQRRLVPTS